MSLLKLLSFKLLGWLRRRLPWLLPRRKPYTALHVEDVPDDLSPDHVYLIGEGDHLWSAAFKCPGGCGALLEINLVADMRPVWHVTADGDGAITIEPSVWRQKDCGCHFRIRNGRVIWY
jgi:Family of unknown function (DUF6527)